MFCKNSFILKTKKKPAFTLPEVLLTLLIIGLIAAVTIPILLGYFEQQKFLSGLKKAYTQFNQALIGTAHDFTCTGDLICTGLFKVGTTSQTLGTELVKHFNVLKNCETNTLGCFSESVSDSYDGSLARTDDYAKISSGFYRFISADGIAFILKNNHNNCSSSMSTGVTQNMEQVCGELYIDLNGLKPPNNMGKDIFRFYITNGKGPLLYPSGGIDDQENGHWKNGDTAQHCFPSDTDGNYCAARIIEEGWKMDYLANISSLAAAPLSEDPPEEEEEEDPVTPPPDPPSPPGGCIACQ
ncbi:MAG TPA: prepilin-type N-terminal cleavage/methylation domain-containing protein [Candidatus Gastranaerophilaceae bacterium]|nr:prepilin-type N-terminal cleavage/methylation domain-containing protein [Candidatus Gastranaerophilaceae bacterium]HPT41781.1 prepilin-type N-terminal cleavage/methylation domain-containing protein [Candidatus Gastranaerophilaceae bacterium]